MVVLGMCFGYLIGHLISDVLKPTVAVQVNSFAKIHSCGTGKFFHNDISRWIGICDKSSRWLHCTFAR